MPRYDYRCPEGHVLERILPVTAVTADCFCGAEGRRVAVNQFATARQWGGDFVMPSSVRSAIEESNGYKAEAVSAMKEAVGNGWRKANG